MKDYIDEKILLFRLQTRRDERAFEELYRRYRPALLRFIYVKVPTREIAEDMLSEVFVGLWRYVNEKRRITHFRGLAFKIARTQIASYYRSEEGRQHVSLDEISEKALKYEEAYQEVDTELLNAVFSLKPEDVEIVMLRYVEGMRVRDIAQIFGKKATSISMQLHRALKKLKDELAKGSDAKDIHSILNK